MSTKNKIQDLNNHLFAQLEKLQDDDIDLQKETDRAKAMCSVADRIIESYKTQTIYAKMRSEVMNEDIIIPALEVEVRKQIG